MATLYEQRTAYRNKPVAVDETYMQEALDWFKPLYAPVQRQGQEAVNAFLWPLLEEEDYSETLKLIFHRIGYSTLLHRSLFAAPGMTFELAEIVMRSGKLAHTENKVPDLRNLERYGFSDLLPLAQREDFSRELLLTIAEELQDEYQVVIFLDEMSKEKELLDHYAYVYAGLTTRRLNHLIYLNDSRTTIAKKLISLAEELNPELPTSWIKNMFDTLRAVDVEKADDNGL